MSLQLLPKKIPAHLWLGLYKSKSIFYYDIIVIDESSMITCDLLTKLIKIKDRIRGKIIFLGDPAQLPPVNEANSLIFHTNDIPKFRLKEIMRYKGNIVDLCDKVRELVFHNETKPILLYLIL